MAARIEGRKLHYNVCWPVRMQTWWLADRAAATIPIRPTATVSSKHNLNQKRHSWSSSHSMHFLSHSLLLRLLSPAEWQSWQWGFLSRHIVLSPYISFFWSLDPVPWWQVVSCALDKLCPAKMELILPVWCCFDMDCGRFLRRATNSHITKATTLQPSVTAKPMKGLRGTTWDC